MNRLKYCVFAALRLGRRIWDAVSGTPYLGRCIWDNSVTMSPNRI